MRARLRLRRLRSRDEPFWRQVRARCVHAVRETPTRSAIVAATIVAVPSAVVAGPVAAAAAAAYTVAAVRSWRRHLVVRAAARARRSAAHEVRLLAADLRAGAMASRGDAIASGGVEDAWDSRVAETDPACRQLRTRLSAVADLAERIGMPAADLLDRLALDLRSRTRVEAVVTSQTAGSVASARLLAGLPLVGLGMGEAMGADATGFLLQTPLGAGCAITALLLQGIGLRWARRLSRMDVGHPGVR